MLTLLYILLPVLWAIHSIRTLKGLPGKAPPLVVPIPGNSPYKGSPRFLIGFTAVLKPRNPRISLARKTAKKPSNKPIGFTERVFPARKPKGKPRGLTNNTPWRPYKGFSPPKKDLWGWP